MANAKFLSALLILPAPNVDFIIENSWRMLPTTSMFPPPHPHHPSLPPFPWLNTINNWFIKLDITSYSSSKLYQWFKLYSIHEGFDDMIWKWNRFDDILIHVWFCCEFWRTMLLSGTVVRPRGAGESAPVHGVRLPGRFDAVPAAGPAAPLPVALLPRQPAVQRPLSVLQAVPR